MIEVVWLDPTGNLTCLVTRKTEGEDEAAITRELMKECEQVAYLEKPAMQDSRARIRLMGGEFCRNATMAGACFLAREDGLTTGKERTMQLEVSGAARPLVCRVRRTGENEFEGTVPMPSMESIQQIQEGRYILTAVKMEGITHFILENAPLLDREEAEGLLRGLAEEMKDDAMGLLQWNRKIGYMTPLVFVPGSETLVWETGCGSGSAAVGIREAMRRGDGTTEVNVRQPGGVIRVSVEVRQGWPERIRITGRVRIGEVQERKIG